MKRNGQNRTANGNVRKRCPQEGCRSTRVVCNGSYQSKRGGRVQRFICRDCGNTWKNFDEPLDSTFSVTDIRSAPKQAFQAFALLAMGLPLDQVESLVGNKSETIRSRLLRCAAHPEIWNEVTEILMSDYGVQSEEISDLSSFLDRVRHGHASFHAISRREIDKRLHETQPCEGAWEFRKRSDFVAAMEKDQSGTLTDEDCERFSNLMRPAKIPTKQAIQACQRLKHRVEAVLGCEIVVTTRGEFFKCEGDPRIERWMRVVKDYKVANNDERLRLLPQMQRLLFDQIRSPNQHAQILAKLEGARGRKVGEKWESRMTLKCLSDRLGAEPEIFIKWLKFTAKILAPPRRGR